MNPPDPLHAAPCSPPLLSADLSTPTPWVLGPRFIESAQDFVAGFHTEVYLRWRLQETGLNLEPLRPAPAALEAMRAAGYADWTKFRLHLPLWHRLARPMPRGYARFLGAQEETLLATAEQDRADARRAGDLPSRPTVFGGRYFGPLPFPDACRNDADCLAHVVGFSRQNGPGTFFRVSGLKSYSVAPGGRSAWTTLYEFRVCIRRKHIEFVQEEQRHDVPTPDDMRPVARPA